MCRYLLGILTTLFLSFSAVPSWAQTTSPSSEQNSSSNTGEVQAVFVGQLLYLDEPLYWGGGGSIRYYFADRFGVEGEVLFVKTSDFEDLLVTPYFVFRFGHRNGSIGYYLKGGIGLRHETDLRIDYTFDDWLVQGALGVRVALSRKSYFVAEGRIIGFAAGMGYAF